MIRTVRAAAFAATACGFAASALWGAPVLAWEGEAAPAASHYLNHAAADPGVSDLGLNDDLAEAPDAGAPAGLAEHMVALAAAAAPEPRALHALVEAQAAADTSGAEEHCLASAVYFEARGELLEGQLAVAEVVINRAASGRYPATLCGVVVQPAQFSFVRRGVIPRADRASDAWRRAVAISRIARQRTTRLLADNVLWYHADYVSPRWGRRLARTARIGLHVFYS